MSEENWEEPDGSYEGTAENIPEYIPPAFKQSSQGRIFGMRGRGFSPAASSQADPGRKSIGQSGRSGFDSDNSERGNFASSYGRENYRYDSFESFQSGHGSQRNREAGDGWTQYGGNKPDDKALPKKPYIPDHGVATEEELFSGGISSGINFGRYDHVNVQVTGENIPKKISSFDEAQLCCLVAENIKRCGYIVPTPIQKHALPIIMSGRDMMACAQTGSGKTAAFLIPIINCLLQGETFSAGTYQAATPQLLVVTPTRELAVQIYVEAKKFTFGSYLKTEICYGGTALRYQIQKVQNGCNILIATPGRLKDFLARGTVSLSEIRYFVFDEADRMLDMKFLQDVDEILNHSSINKDLPAQILMFSATFPIQVQELASTYLKNYLFVAVGIVGGACMDVEQKFYLVPKYEKRFKLIELLEERGSCKTLVFVEQKRTADIIATFLSEKEFPSTSMHGDREQNQREEALNDFKSGKMHILVATAVAARGLDIKNVSHVINFDLPRSVEEYVHRIGRTGRVGNRGLATSFYDPQDDRALAPFLIKTLVQAEQEVPDFLRADDKTGSWTSSFGFGGKDIRRRGRKVDDLDAIETAAGEGHENWA